jgi:hypothetical protein
VQSAKQPVIAFAAKEFLNGVTMTNYSAEYQVVGEAYIKTIEGESLGGVFRSSTFFIYSGLVTASLCNILKPKVLIIIICFVLNTK